MFFSEFDLDIRYITEFSCDYMSGGLKGFSDVVWTVKSYIEDSHITFTYNSLDGEQGKTWTIIKNDWM